MNKRIILALAALLVFGLSIATFAYKQTTATDKTAISCCCCHGDSCPMKKEDSSGKESASCCDKDDCCKGDSCPMKKKDASGKETSCCDGCDCCKGDYKAAPKSVSYYFKGQPIYTASKGSVTCCGANKDQKS